VFSNLCRLQTRVRNSFSSVFFTNPCLFQAYGSIKEELLIEFSYFGRLTKDKPNTKSLDTFEYLQKSLIEDVDTPVSTLTTDLPHNRDSIGEAKLTKDRSETTSKYQFR